MCAEVKMGEFIAEMDNPTRWICMVVNLQVQILEIDFLSRRNNLNWQVLLVCLIISHLCITVWAQIILLMKFMY